MPGPTLDMGNALSNAFNSPSEIGVTGLILKIKKQRLRGLE